MDGHRAPSTHKRAENGRESDRAELDVDAKRADQTRLVVTAFRKVSPIWAEISLRVGGRPMEFWKEIAADAPRLRYLELRVHLAKVDAAYAGWIDNIPGALASLPLLVLRLHLSEMPSVELQMISNVQWHTLDSPVYDLQKLLAKQLYNARVEAARSLPRRLADAVPSLRVVAIADGQSDSDYDGTPFFAHPRGSERVSRLPVSRPRENLDEYANQNTWYMEPVMALDWWRIVRDGDEVVRLDALTANQGERMQRFFEESDLEILDRIDDFISEL